MLVGGLKLGFASRVLWGPVYTLALGGQEKGLENHGVGNKGGDGKDPRISASERRRGGRGLIIERSKHLLLGAS